MDHGPDGPVSEDMRPAVANVLTQVYLATLDGVSATGRINALGVDRAHAEIAVRQVGRLAARVGSAGTAESTSRR